MRKSIKHYAVTIFIIFLILVINVMAYFQYSKNIDEQLTQQTDIHLQAVTDEMVECLDIKMEERLATFKAVATFIGTTEDIKGMFVEEALTKQAQAAGHTEGLVLASDGFLPFDDTVAFAAEYGVTAIVQPGGSVRDEDSIKKANELGITMLFTGMRHFKH